MYRHAETRRPMSPMPYATFLIVSPALPRLGDATHLPHQRYTTRLKDRYDAVTIPMQRYTALL